MSTELDLPPARLAAAPAAKFRPDIEGLRAVAVVFVILDHFGLQPHGGFIGVDVFFVISGFLISGLMIKEYVGSAQDRGGYGTISLKSFYLRRVRRILPAAVVVITTTVILGRFLLNPAVEGNVHTDGLWSLIFFQNDHLISTSTNYFQQGFTPSPLQHYWSLSVEEQFYLVWPAVLLLVATRHGMNVFHRPVPWLRRIEITAALLTFASFAYSVWQTTVAPDSAYFSSPARAFELGIGVLGACWAIRHPEGMRARTAQAIALLGATVLVVAVVVITPGDPYPGVRALLPTVATVLLLVAGVGGVTTTVGRALSVAPVRFVGRISFSLYLWHWPAIILLKPRFPAGWTDAERNIALAVGIFAASTLSYYLVERPFQGYVPTPKDLTARIFLRSRPLTTALAAAVVVVSAATLLPNAVHAAHHRVSGSVPASSEVFSPAQLGEGPATAPTVASEPTTAQLVADQRAFQRAVAASVGLTTVPAGLNPSLQALAAEKGFQPSVCQAEVCTFGSGPRQALIMGNSFAQMVEPMVTGALDLSKWTVTVRWRSGCQVALYTECPTVFDFGAQKLDLLILSDYTYLFPGHTQSEVYSSLATAVVALSKHATHAVYVGQPAGMKAALIDCVNANLNLRSCSSPMAGPGSINTLKRADIAAAGGQFADLSSWICAASCPVIIGETPVYVDSQHLSASLALELAPTFRQFLINQRVLDTSGQ